MAKTAVLGAGAWGTALAWLWAKAGRQITLWGHNVDRAARMQTTRENTDYLPGVKLPESIHVTPELADCAGADLIVFVTPSIALREITGRVAAFLAEYRALSMREPATRGTEGKDAALKELDQLQAGAESIHQGGCRVLGAECRLFADGAAETLCQVWMPARPEQNS